MSLSVIQGSEPLPERTPAPRAIRRQVPEVQRPSGTLTTFMATLGGSPVLGWMVCRSKFGLLTVDWDEIIHTDRGDADAAVAEANEAAPGFGPWFLVEVRRPEGGAA